MKKLEKQPINVYIYLKYILEQDNKEKEKLAQQLIIELNKKDLTHLLVNNNFM